MFLMWAVMMTAMMVPTATPMILTFAAVNRRRRANRQPFVSTGVFLAGYVAVWTAFSVLATLGNWGLHQASLLSSMMGETTNSYLGGSLLLAAGAFQWSPLKFACLNHCRSPMGFVMTSWREGKAGAIRMGLEHGAYCLGCCWVLMALLFVLGIMNLAWIVDRRLGRGRAGRESIAQGRMVQPRQRSCLGRLGHPDDTERCLN